MTRRLLLSGAAAILLGGCGAAMGPGPAAGMAGPGPAVGMASIQASPAPGVTLADRLLAGHNGPRRTAGVPPLRWDPQLAAAAEAYAAELARTNQLVHAPRQSRPGQGENLWMGTAGAYTPEFMVQSWANERRLFRPGRFPNVSTTGNWADVAHYTQMIWRSTTRVGCGIRRGTRSDVMVCRYSPAGNRDGQAVP